MGVSSNALSLSLKELYTECTLLPASIVPIYIYESEPIQPITSIYFIVYLIFFQKRRRKFVIFVHLKKNNDHVGNVNVSRTQRAGVVHH